MEGAARIRSVEDWGCWRGWGRIFFMSFLKCAFMRTERTTTTEDEGKEGNRAQNFPPTVDQCRVEEGKLLLLHAAIRCFYGVMSEST